MARTATDLLKDRPHQPTLAEPTLAALALLEERRLSGEVHVALAEGGIAAGRLHREHHARNGGVCTERGLAGTEAIEHRHAGVDVAHGHPADHAVAGGDRGAVGVPVRGGARHETNLSAGRALVVDAAPGHDRNRSGGDECGFGVGTGDDRLGLGLSDHQVALGGRTDAAGLRTVDHEVSRTITVPRSGDDVHRAAIFVAHLVGADEWEWEFRPLGTGRGNEEGGCEGERQDHERPRAREADPWGFGGFYRTKHEL